MVDPQGRYPAAVARRATCAEHRRPCEELEAAHQCAAAGRPHTLQDDFARAASLPPSTQRCWPPRGRGRSAAVRRSQATHSERASAAQKLQTIMRRLSGAIVRSGLAPNNSGRGVRANAPWRTHCSAVGASAHVRRGGALRTCARASPCHARAVLDAFDLAPRPDEVPRRAWCATQSGPHPV